MGQLPVQDWPTNWPESLEQAGSAPDGAGGWRGLARLGYTLHQGRCVLSDSYTRAPLRVQRPLYPEGEGLCHSVLVHTAGGLVGGDSLGVQLTVGTGAAALVTTAAASKVYGGPGGRGEGAIAAQHVAIDLAPDSCLEWLPQETIVFNRAQYRQQLRVNLAPGARWAGWEITRFGRSARGETFDQGEWRSHLEVWQGDTPLWLDRQRLEGGSPALASPNGLAGQPVVGSFALVGHCPTAADLDSLRQLWATDQPGSIGVTRLQTGVLCRYRGPSSQAARRWFIAAWQHLRPGYLGRTATRSRVWPD
ncbi:MAG TPA: urease accessory protein UreD [Nodosilinea sp.]|nr:urease accessory protein UreD [Nodosilinea sp.]